nr:cytochrome p450 CYP3049B1 [Brachionus angularis]
MLTYILILIALILLSLWLYLTIKIIYLRRKYKHIPGPTAQGILGFYLGIVKEIEILEGNGKIIEEKFLEWVNIYGPVFKFQIGFNFYVITTDKTAIKEICLTKCFPMPEKEFEKFMFPYGIRFIGYGLSTECNHQRWYHRRSIYNQGFQRNALMSFLNHFNLKSDLLMEKLSKYADEKTSFNLYEEISGATIDIIARVLFQMDLDSINSENDRSFNKLFVEIVEIMKRHLSDPFAEINPFKISDRKQFKKLSDLIRNKLKELTLERLKDDQNNIKDVLSLMIEACIDKEKSNFLDFELLIDDFITFFLAGTETTVKTLSCCINFLSNHTDALKKAQKEIFEVVGYKNEITYDDLTKLKYCSSVLKETLRLKPAFPSVMRLCNTDFTIKGLQIPINTVIWLSPYLSGRIEQNFSDPNDFKPERFLKSETNQVDSYAYFPFGLGPRSCIGQNFSQIESVVILAKFLQRFDYEVDLNHKANKLLEYFQSDTHYILTKK